MAGKYEPLTAYLRTMPADEEVGIDLRVLDRMVHGLPPNARTAGWWANTAGHSQALAWLSLARRARVDLAAGRVVFSAAGPEPVAVSRTPSAPRVQPITNGITALDAVLRRAGYQSVAAAVAEHAVFLDPRTVEQSGGEAIFPVVRDMIRRGQLGNLPNGRPVLFDDNTTPTWAFLWAAGRNKGPDVQYNHVWTDSQNPALYTALWNLCATPAFLAKTTDGQNHPEVRRVLQYRAYQLYGAHPSGDRRPDKPEGFDDLTWAPMPEPPGSLEETYRSRLRAAPKSRMAIAARRVGWLYSRWEPDATLGSSDGPPMDAEADEVEPSE